MTTAMLFERLGLALAIGLLIGIERGWQEREGKPGSRAAGIRTHALIGLLGGIWGLLTPLAGPIVLGLVALGFTGAFTLFEWEEMHSEGSFSATGTIAGLLSFALGAYAVLGNTFAAASAGVAATVILAERQLLHQFLARLKWTELRAALLLLVMTVVLLPVLPDRPIDPWGALNPFQIWLMIVLIAATSYGGYIAVQVAGGRKGLLYAGAAGGLVSSTTVTWTFAQFAKNEADARGEIIVGITTSWAVSLARVLIVVAVLAPGLAETLAAPIAAPVIVWGLAAAWFYRHAGEAAKGTPLALEDPFDIATVLRFGVLLVVIMLATKWLSHAFGGMGLYGLAAVSGLADVDPITLSMAQAARSGSAVGIADGVILVALAANTLAKCVLAWIFGGRKLGLFLSLIAAAGVTAAAIAFAFVHAH
jgi:uncharacterized membrane protein (DUF4010 family)